MAKEIYLGENLNKALVAGPAGERLLVLDGREWKNPAAARRVPAGTYRVTRTDGCAPGGVDYYGTALPAADIEAEQEGGAA